jgi:hypothetical protein
VIRFFSHLMYRGGSKPQCKASTTTSYPLARIAQMVCAAIRGSGSVLSNRSAQRQSREGLASISKKLSPHYLVRRLSQRLKITCIRSEKSHFPLCRDDLEFHLQPPQGIIAVRSAVRLGYYDFGVNRRWVEEIRAKLRA